MSAYKIPVSVLVVVHSADARVLLLERADAAGYWQSVTGSVNPGETLVETAIREVREETGLDATAYELKSWGIENRYEIYARWRHRYAPGVTHNTESVFGLKLPAPMPVTLSPDEHVACAWLPWEEAAARCFSPSNAAAIRQLPARL
ncbi:MAG TPA: dihydroneopterin triphosphate diphosphatase [Thiobacillaceae bacterium]|nr:dihydroneopterin triphosphate diphosphatase [Thiobacillaceae bacterium]